MAELKQFKRAEVAGCGPKDIHFVIHDKVYNVTAFLNEHPGGEEVLLDHRGKDASEDFDDVGHSTDALALMDKYLIGEIVKEERTNSHVKDGWQAKSAKPVQIDKSSDNFYIYVVVVIVAIVGFYWLSGS